MRTDMKPVVVLAIALSASIGLRSQAPPFVVDATNIRQTHAALAAGTTTCASIARAFLDRIEAYDDKGPTLHAVISVNQHALDIAESMDRSRKSGVALQPLHCIPVILKDNFDTADMPTT